MSISLLKLIHLRLERAMFKGKKVVDISESYYINLFVTQIWQIFAYIHEPG